MNGGIVVARVFPSMWNKQWSRMPLLAFATYYVAMSPGSVRCHKVFWMPWSKRSSARPPKIWCQSRCRDPDADTDIYLYFVVSLIRAIFSGYAYFVMHVFSSLLVVCVCVCIFMLRSCGMCAGQSVLNTLPVLQRSTFFWLVRLWLSCYCPHHT